MILANGFLIIVETFTERFSQRTVIFDYFLPFELHYLNRSLSIIIGFFFIYLSFNLFRRKLVAWIITLALLILVIILHIGNSHFFLDVASSAILLILLIIERKSFRVRSEVQSITRGFLVLITSIIFALAYGTVGFWFLDKRDFHIDFTIRRAFETTINQFLLTDNSMHPHTRNAVWFLDSLNFLGITAFAFGVYNLFRPIAYRLSTLPGEREQVKELLKKYGSSDLDFFKTAGDKSYFFNMTKKSVVAYKTVGGVAISLGNPLGPQSEMKSCIEEFLDFCQSNGWRAAFISISQKLLPIYKNHGLRFFQIGQEAIVDLKKFATTTSHKKDFSRVVKKFDQIGFQVAYHTPPHSFELFIQLKQVSDNWLSTDGHKEFSFIMGKFDTSYLNKTNIFTVSNEKGQIVAFVNQIPTFQKGEATIDLMRHRDDIVNGTMDYLFAKFLKLLFEEGYTYFNLGLAALSGVGQQKESPPEEQLIGHLVKYFDQFYSFEGLRRYKEKFDPVWQPKYLAYQGNPTSLISISLALTRAIEG